MQYGDKGVKRGCNFNIQLFGGYAADGRLVMYAHEKVLLTGATNRNLFGAKVTGRSLSCSPNLILIQFSFDVYRLYH